MAAASEQVPDSLRYKGKQYNLFSTPLEAYFARHPKRRLKPKIVSTDCWRGYMAGWEIRDTHLQLVSLRDCDRKPLAPGITQLKKGARASWFSGVLRVPLGKKIQFVHQGFHSQYEKDLLIWLRRGKVVRERVFDNRPNKRARISRPRPRRTVAKALSKARATIKRECFKTGPRPRSVLLQLRVTAAGVHLDLELKTRLSVEAASCVSAHVKLEAAFAPADGEELVRHRLSLR
jgi:hypothetical protein